MAFQSTVANQMGYGVVGEFAFEGPVRAQPYTLESDDATYNVFGRAFTIVSEGVAKAGGTGVFAGLLVNPKEHALSGTTAGGTLAASLALRNEELASLATMGEVIVAVPGNCALGDKVTYNQTTGVLGTVNGTAAFTASQSTTVLTVTAITAGNLGIGSVVNTGASVVTIVSLGTGTGGTGTYNVNVSQTVSSGAMTASSVPASGFSFVPNASITHFDPSGAGLAVATLTN